MDELLTHLDSHDPTFLGGESHHAFEHSITPFPVLVHFALKQPPVKSLQYFGEAVKAGAHPSELLEIAGDLVEYDERPNPGTRARFASRLYGKGFEASKQEYQPRRLESSDRLERSVAALKLFYDSPSGFDHQVIIGKHLEGTHSAYPTVCRTAAFYHDQNRVMHAVFPHSMMFDSTITEDQCSGCVSLSICRGKDEYTSAVFFNPQNHDPEFLSELEKTIPGVFELHLSDTGLHRPEIFSVFPPELGQVYYHPAVTLNLTPVQSNQAYTNMVMFPSNIPGSSYLASSLRGLSISHQPVDWPDETLTATENDFRDPEKFKALEAKMTHLRGREITTNRNPTGIIYHPSMDDRDFLTDVNRGWVIYSGDTPFTIEPAHQRKITSSK